MKGSIKAGPWYALLVAALYLLPLTAGVLDADSTPEPQRITLDCPDGGGLCRWSKRGGWEAFWRSPRAALTRDLWSMADGKVVALLRGHADAGTVVVLDVEGRIVLEREVAPEAGMPLGALAGATDGGQLVLCGGGTERVFCDTRLFPRGDLTALPEGCAFPRELADGRALCLELWPKVALRIERGKTGIFPRIELPLDPVTVYVEYLEVLDGDTVLLGISGRVFAWRDGALTPLEFPPLSWLRRVGGALLLAGCEADETGEDLIGACRVSELRPDLTQRVLWQAVGCSALSEVQTLTASTMVLDVYCRRERQLIEVGVGERVELPAVLWSGPVASSEVP